MTDRSQDILPKLDQLIGMVSAVQEALAAVQETLAAVQAEQRQHGERICRLEGKVDILTVWMQSIDQRFMALMAPVSPPRKPAAE